MSTGAPKFMASVMKGVTSSGEMLPLPSLSSMRWMMSTTDSPVRSFT